jgi:hypothetical protein
MEVHRSGYAWYVVLTLGDLVSRFSIDSQAIRTSIHDASWSTTPFVR